MKIIVVSGGFDPLHSGHINYFKEAKALGDYLIVALNSDEWLIKKKGKFFMPFNERLSIIEHLSSVDKVIDFEDDDQGSCIQALRQVKDLYPNDDIIFCNGGDREKDNIPEMNVDGINFQFNIGGSNKMNSSSWILREWAYDSEERSWGKFFNIFTDYRLKVKELIVSPGKGMSLQRHFKRNEIWFVSKGSCKVNFSNSDPDSVSNILLNTEDTFHVRVGKWHQIFNPFKDPCHLIEIQYGEEISEEDIQRHSYYLSDVKN